MIKIAFIPNFQLNVKILIDDINYWVITISDICDIYDRVMNKRIRHIKE